MIELYPHQLEALNKLHTGSVLCGGVGSGKSRTALAYFYEKECGGSLTDKWLGLKTPKDLYIITTARKRDTLEWERECAIFMLSKDSEVSFCGIKVNIDSWNNIKKYEEIKDCFFIFDEQRVVGNGAWVKSFLKITKKNTWILLSATPGDTWMDYIPVFLANGFYKNRTEFIRRHVIYSRFTKYPKVDKYIDCGRLIYYRDLILVDMPFERKVEKIEERVQVSFDRARFKNVIRSRWNIYENKPINDAGELCYILRKLVNTEPERFEVLRQLYFKHKKVIVFYNFNYELEILRQLSNEGIEVKEWNGHKHEAIPETDSWVYLVQYTAGAEGWNCTETNCVIFYSLNYSYKLTKQAAGRIDRLNTPFDTLYYYTLYTASPIDLSIMKALSEKKNFNEKAFALNY